MGKILLGILIGVAISGSVFSLLGSSGSETAAPASQSVIEADGGFASSDESVVQSRAESISGTGESRIASEGTSAAAPFAPDNNGQPDRLALPEDEVAREVRLRREVDEAQAFLRRAADELQQLAIARMLADNPVVSPSPLPPEFGWVADDLYRGVFHERFQREPIDGAWSGPMETELLRFVYDQPGIVERYGPPTIRCHTRRCEVLFTTASGVGVDAEADVKVLWEGLLEAMPDTFECVQNTCWASGNQQGGIATMFWGMVVKRGDEPQGLVASASE